MKKTIGDTFRYYSDITQKKLKTTYGKNPPPFKI